MPRMSSEDTEMLAGLNEGQDDEMSEDVLDRYTNKDQPFFDSVESHLPVEADKDELDDLIDYFTCDKRISTASTHTIGTSTGVDEDVEDDATEEDEIGLSPPKSTQAKSANSKTTKKTRARVASEGVKDGKEDEKNKRPLRPRNIKQVHPFLADKVHHEMSKKNGGHKVASADVDKAVEATQRKAVKKKQGKKTTTTKAPMRGMARQARASTSTSRSPSAAITSNASPSPTLDEDRVQNNTTLSTYLTGDPGTVVDIGLSDCSTLAALYDQIQTTWGQRQHKRVSEVRYILSWKSETVKHLMLEDWDGVFDQMNKAIRKAPAWGKKGEGALEVKVEVSLEA